MCPARPTTEALADMSGLLGGPHDLANERVRPAAVAAAVTNAAEPDAEVVVTCAHRRSPVRQNGDGAERAEMLGVSLGRSTRTHAISCETPSLRSLRSGLSWINGMRFRLTTDHQSTPPSSKRPPARSTPGKLRWTGACTCGTRTSKNFRGDRR